MSTDIFVGCLIAVNVVFAFLIRDLYERIEPKKPEPKPEEKKIDYGTNSVNK